MGVPEHSFHLRVAFAFHPGEPGFYHAAKNWRSGRRVVEVSAGNMLALGKLVSDGRVVVRRCWLIANGAGKALTQVPGIFSSTPT
jgi:hypothetical protein